MIRLRAILALTILATVCVARLNALAQGGATAIALSVSAREYKTLATPQATVSEQAQRCAPMINVIIRRDTLMARMDRTNVMLLDALIAESRQLAQPLGKLVKSSDISPAVRTIRLKLADSTTKPSVDRAMAALRATPSVQDVSTDDCSMHSTDSSARVPHSTSTSAVIRVTDSVRSPKR